MKLSTLFLSLLSAGIAHSQSQLFIDVFPDSSKNALMNYSVEEDFMYHQNQYIGNRYDEIDSVRIRFNYPGFVQFFIYKDSSVGKMGLIVHFDNQFKATKPIADSIVFGKPDSYTNFEYFFKGDELTTERLNVLFYQGGEADLWQVSTALSSCQLTRIGKVQVSDFYIPMYTYEFDESGNIHHISAEFHNLKSGEIIKNEVFDQMIVNFETGQLVTEQTEEGESRYAFSSNIASTVSEEYDFGSFVRIWYCVATDGSMHVADYRLVERY